MADNLEIWNSLSTPPATALKQIMGGRLNGKTDIKPQWRYQAMTEKFGPCGIGWKYTIDKLWTEQGADGQVFAFALVSVFVKWEGTWSEAIPGQGGSMLVEKERAGLFSSDEGFKMAITDALSVSLKMLGVAAEVYMGNWDGSKFRDQPADGKAKPQGNPPPPPQPYQGQSGTPPQVRTKREEVIALVKESMPFLTEADVSRLRVNMQAAGTTDALLEEVAKDVHRSVEKFKAASAAAGEAFDTP